MYIKRARIERRITKKKKKKKKVQEEERANEKCTE
jgi:hypothetical protein